MDERDSELDGLLAPLKKIESNELQLKRWQSAVQKELKNNQSMRPRREMVKPFAAALIAGFILGALTLSAYQRLNDSTQTIGEEKINPNATTEYIFAKSE